MEVNAHLANFKERGIISFDKVFSISSANRIPALTKSQDGRYQVLIALTASLKSALNNINLRVGLNEDQIIELADAIIDQSYEDNLSLEDVLLFLQKLLAGECGKIYDRLDMPTFFEMFEKYRQQRYEALQNIRDEQNIQYKIAGSSDVKREKRDDVEIDPVTFFDLLKTYHESGSENDA